MSATWPVSVTTPSSTSTSIRLTPGYLGSNFFELATHRVVAHGLGDRDRSGRLGGCRLGIVVGGRDDRRSRRSVRFRRRRCRQVRQNRGLRPCALNPRSGSPGTLQPRRTGMSPCLEGVARLSFSSALDRLHNVSTAMGFTSLSAERRDATSLKRRTRRNATSLNASEGMLKALRARAKKCYKPEGQRRIVSSCAAFACASGL